MLKRVFPEKQLKSANRCSNSNSSTIESTLFKSSTKADYQRSDSSDVNSVATTLSSSANSSPLKSSIARISSSSSGSPVKSEVNISSQGSASEFHSGTTAGASNFSKLKTISRSCSSTEFQSLKLESMSTVEEFKSVSKAISSTIDREGISVKQTSSAQSIRENDHQDVTSLSTPSDDDLDADPTDSLFKQQSKFFFQMKEYLLSQQSSLRQHLELLNATVASRKKNITPRRQRFVNSGHSVHIPTKQKTETAPDIRGNNHEVDLMNEFHSCSSTEKSDDDIQVCPLCGVEIEDSKKPEALEEHVASHWCSPDDPI